MSRKDFMRSFNIIALGAMSGTATITSAASSIQTLDDVGVQLSWTGSPVGNFQIQISADYDPVTKTAGVWTPMLFNYWNGATFIPSVNLPTSEDSPYYIDMAWLSAPWIRVSYTNTSGSGVLTAYLCAKAV